MYCNMLDEGKVFALRREAFKRATALILHANLKITQQ